MIYVIPLFVIFECVRDGGRQVTVFIGFDYNVITGLVVEGVGVVGEGVE